MNSQRIDHLWKQIRAHIALFFKAEALALIEDSTIRFLPYSEALGVREPSIVIPTDVRFEIHPRSAYRVPLNGTILTLWNPLPPPAEHGWEAIPDAEHPLWYRHESGTHIPGWNLFGNLFGLLTFQEEAELPARDEHSRFTGTYSPRCATELLEVPAFNEAVAALVAACLGLKRNGRVALDSSELIKPGVLVLSHDCDVLRGNDRWTQGVRAARTVLPLLKGHPPRLSNLRWMLLNVIKPERYYFDNITEMIALEGSFGYTSTFYLLNGSAGRYGARSGSGLLPRLVKAVPPNWDIGIHYNYDTYLDPRRFAEQKRELTQLLDHAPRVGRAHYLRFDSGKSLPFLESQGIECDESAGYADCIGYRCGIGGCFQAFDPSAEKPLGIWELPMVVMDVTIHGQYESSAANAFEKLVRHLSRVGGALSLLFHPGVFNNPEVKGIGGLYHRMLSVSRELGFRSETALALTHQIPARLKS